MAVCFHRKVAWLVEDKGIFFKKPFEPSRMVTIPCGKCLACRVNSAAQWATRASHESRYCDNGCFVTLTYSPEYVPANYELCKKDVQDFLKRLRVNLHRRNLGHLRAFFACGEYGERRGRPHYHLLLLGFCPNDLKPFSSSPYSGMQLFTSKFLEDTWGKGFCPVGTITSGSAAYVARYQKKASASNSGLREKPFFLTSRNIPLTNGKEGALGAQWLIDNHQALRFGYVVHPEKPNIKVRIPEYYFDLLEKWYPDEYERIKKLRYDFAMEKTSGFYQVEDSISHLPSILLPEDFTEADRLELLKFCGEDEISDISVADLLKKAVDKVRRESEQQDKRLSTLKRGIHNA